MSSAPSELALRLLLTASAGGAPPERPTPDWFFAVFPLFFAGMWILVSTLLGRMAGHMALLDRYPPVDEREEETFGWASGKMRGVSFNNALHVGLGARGLHLAANALFRPILRRGIPCIPWQEIRLVRPQPRGIGAWFRGSKFEVTAPGIPFVLNGAAGRAVERKLAMRSPAIDRPRSQLVRQ